MKSERMPRRKWLQRPLRKITDMIISQWTEIDKVAHSPIPYIQMQVRAVAKHLLKRKGLNSMMSLQKVEIS